MGTIQQKVQGYLPESTTVPVISDAVAERIGEVIAIYDLPAEAEMSEKQKIMVALEACLLIIPAAIDYYKSRPSDTTVMGSTLTYADRISGLQMLQENLSQFAKVVKSSLGYSEAKQAMEGFVKVTEDDEFYTT